MVAILSRPHCVFVFVFDELYLYLIRFLPVYLYLYLYLKLRKKMYLYLYLYLIKHIWPQPWLQARAQRVVIVVLPSLNSLRIDSRNNVLYRDLWIKIISCCTCIVLNTPVYIYRRDIEREIDHLPPPYICDYNHLAVWYETKVGCQHQYGTKPNLVAKILATNFGVFFVI